MLCFYNTYSVPRQKKAFEQVRRMQKIYNMNAQLATKAVKQLYITMFTLISYIYIS